MEHSVGHRERIRDRLLISKSGSLTDTELMEILLCIALPRRNTKILAKDLLKKYGNFSKTIAAEPESLLSIKGVGKSVLSCFKLIREGAIMLAREEIKNKPVISSWQKLLDYCRISIGHLEKEVFMVMYLNSQNELIDQELQEHGTVDQISIYPREITKRALLLNASAVILVHNHPGGSSKASKSDIETTKKISSALSPFNIRIHDHVIISNKNFLSFKSEGLL